MLTPQGVRNLALMTVETAEDDIAAPGQTVAAHKLFTSIPADQRKHLLLPRGGHFSTFHGEDCRHVVAPAIVEFLRNSVE